MPTTNKKQSKTKTEIVKLGMVGVDSGQLIMCDPLYIESQYIKRNDDFKKSNHPVYQHKKDKKFWQYCHRDDDGTLLQEPTNKNINPFPKKYDDIIPEYRRSPNFLIEHGDFIETKIDPYSHVSKGEFSYMGICDVTNNNNMGGQLNYKLGHEGVGVAFQTGFGDGLYPVYAEIVETKYGKRISKVWVDFELDEGEKKMDELVKRGNGF